jgi:hypothetical protein
MPLPPVLSGNQQITQPNPTLWNDVVPLIYFTSFIKLQALEAAFEYGRPAYKQVKYLAPLGGIEYAADGLLQLYDDRNKDLTTPQYFARGVIRGFESAAVDVISLRVGLFTGATIQAGVPIPFVPAGVGYVIGAYSTSVILDNWVVQHNPVWFYNLGLGDP